ncbi:MAG: hypothetical protein AAF587_44795, partial [Bacteroidota bacterium]
ALSFDEVIVTTFTAGQQQTLPIWMLEYGVPPVRVDHDHIIGNSTDPTQQDFSNDPDYDNLPKEDRSDLIEDFAKKGNANKLYLLTARAQIMSVQESPVRIGPNGIQQDATSEGMILDDSRLKEFFQDNMEDKFNLCSLATHGLDTEDGWIECNRDSHPGGYFRHMDYADAGEFQVQQFDSFQRLIEKNYIFDVKDRRPVHKNTKRSMPWSSFVQFPLSQPSQNLFHRYKSAEFDPDGFDPKDPLKFDVQPYYIGSFNWGAYQIVTTYINR